LGSRLYDFTLVHGALAKDLEFLVELDPREAVVLCAVNRALRSLTENRIVVFAPAPLDIDKRVIDRVDKLPNGSRR